MKKNVTVKVVLATVMLFFGFAMMSEKSAADEGNVILVVSGGATTAVPTETAAPTPTVVPTATPDVSKIKINTKKVVLMAKKKYTLSVTGTKAPITWKSSNPSVATVSKKGVVKGVKEGKADILAKVSGVTMKCAMTIVPKMSKKDFGKFTSENFVGYCQRKAYDQDGGYAWVGQWEGGSKKKTTYRGIKVGMKKSKVLNAYGQLNVKKCTGKDPFTKMKGLKNNKVKTYVDMKYGKYRIRFYFNKKNKIMAIIFSCNFSKIKESALSKYI